MFYIYLEKILLLLVIYSKVVGGKYEDTKWVIIICKSKKDRQHNGQKKKDKMTNSLLKKYYAYSLCKMRVFIRVRVARSLVFCVMFCRSLFVILTFFFWPVCCLFFSDLRNLSTPLVSSNFSFLQTTIYKTLRRKLKIEQHEP
jgi:hypothetical protein